MFIRQPKFKYVFAISWLVLTLALATWWVYVLNDIIARLESGVIDWSEYLPKLKNMVFWEGLTLILLILGGAIPLLYLIYSEDLNTQRIKQFFASFSHDLKTSMTSLKLQAEVIQEGLADSSKSTENNMNQVVDRLLGDTERLHLQLENSLYLASDHSGGLFIQPVALQEVTEALKRSWPHLNIKLSGPLQDVNADKKSLEMILNNICHNSLIHGEAKNLEICVSEASTNRVQLQISDDGKGFTGNLEDLAHPFVRHNPSSGSGMGLFIAKNLIKIMNGDFILSSPNAGNSGFQVTLVLPRADQ